MRYSSEYLPAVLFTTARPARRRFPGSDVSR